jgi:signal transduction histidine kinase
MKAPTNQQINTAAASARLYFIVSMVSGLLLLTVHVFDRVELQTINSRFEMRRWLSWAAPGLAKLSPRRLWRYHQEHEIPRQWWAWDYTLSWLLADNHPESRHKFILFNHQLEDEPPLEALSDHPWMKPLYQYPLSRATLAETITFLARSGVKMIILDNDFPQFTADDKTLAQSILSCYNGKAAGHPVPILMARTVNRRSQENILQLEIPTAPSGLINQLKGLDSKLNALDELTGSTGVVLDEDQVVRRLASRIPTMNGEVVDSIAVKTLKALHEKVPEEVPLLVDIDFAGPPNSEIYPIRPISYLLDPDRRAAMTDAKKAAGDVTLNGAVVILGDSVVDLFNTPTTNFGVNQMSGAEVLANSIDTLSRRSWLVRLNWWQQIGYLTAIVLACAFINFLWKSQAAKAPVKPNSPRLLSSELGGFLLMIVGSYAIAVLLFTKMSVIAPAVVPTISLTLASFATLQWERARERAAALERDLKAAQDNLALQGELHRTELERQKAVADAHEAMMDRERRQEFARRINHDLRAPVSVLSWTIAKLKGKKLTETERLEKIDRLTNTTDRLFGLINELVASYSSEGKEPRSEQRPETCNVKTVLENSVQMQKVLADEKKGTLKLLEASDRCLVETSTLQLGRVVDNIIRNAFIHNHPGISVTITLTTDGRRHQIRIADTGQGIAKEHLAQIFKAGYRAGKEVNKQTADGQGLGLDIVNSFVENMNGSVQVESTVGEGTTFIINLPASKNGIGEKSEIDASISKSSAAG